MKTRFWKTAVCFLLLLTVCISPLLLSVSAASAPTFTVEVPSAVVSGKVFAVAVRYTGTEVLDIKGLSLRLTYDGAKMTGITESQHADVTGMTGGDITAHVASGSVSIIWSGSAQWYPGKAVYFSFTATESTAIQLDSISLYGADMAEITAGAVTNGNVTVNSVAVAAVMTAIDNIGTVENTVACGEKIENAWKQYQALATADRLLVTNYDTLVAAKMTYAGLQQEADAQAVAQEVAKFKQEHAYALSLTLYNVSTAKDEDGNLKDAVAINAALDALNTLSASAQGQLAGQRNTLTAAYAALEVLAKDEIDKMNAAEAEKKAMEQAQRDVEEFRTGEVSTWVLALTVDTVRIQDEDAINNVMSILTATAGASKYHEALLEEDKAHLQSLLDKIAELESLLPPPKSEEELAAESFRESFSYVLSLTPEAVTREDAVDINIAHYAYGTLDYTVQGYLTAEGELLGKLMDAIAALPEDSDPKPTEEPTNPPATKPVPQPTEGKDPSIHYDVNVHSRSMSRIVWILLIVIGILALVFIMLYALYARAKKKSK